jgi:hypothetical protein
MSKRTANQILSIPTLPAGESEAEGVGVTAPDRPPAQPLLWDLTEAAAALRLSERSLKRLDAEDALPRGVVVRIGRRRLFARKALEQWVADGCPPVRGRSRR